MSNVRSAAVEVAQPKPAQASLAVVVREAIEDQADAFAQVLPAHVDADKFARLVLSAVKGTPQLVECFATTQGKTSVLLAAMQAAVVGVSPNTPTLEAWILPRRVKAKDDRGREVWITEAELQIGYRGYTMLAENAGAQVYAEVVHEGDEFTFSRGLDHDDLRHVPCDDPGPITHAYAVARFPGTNKAPAFLVMSWREIEKRRDASPSYSGNGKSYSPWHRWPEEMAKKTVVRALCKQQLRLSADAMSATESDGARLSLGDGVIEARHDEERPALAAAPVLADESTSAEAPTTDEPVEAPATPDDGPVDGPPTSAEVVPDEPLDVAEVESEPAPAPVSDDEGPTGPEMTAEQWRAVQRLLRLHRQAAGPTTFSTLSEILGRPVANRNDLDGDDAARVIDLLQAEADAKAADTDPPPDAA